MDSLIKTIWILIFCIQNENIIAQQKLENDIISSLINSEFKTPDPDTIYTRKGKIKKVKYFQVPDIVLVRETQTNTRIHGNDSTIIEFLKKELPGFDIEIYNDFREKNLHPIIIDSINGYKGKIYYTSKADLNTLLDGGRGWMSFYRKYHYSPFVEVSRPGINKVQNKALVFFSQVHAPLGGSGVFLLLELESNDWIVKGWSLVWIS
jgi:hypothetical protein